MSGKVADVYLIVGVNAGETFCVFPLPFAGVG
jgi:hypothetical protein